MKSIFDMKQDELLNIVKVNAYPKKSAHSKTKYLILSLNPEDSHLCPIYEGWSLNQLKDVKKLIDYQIKYLTQKGN